MLKKNFVTLVMSTISCLFLGLGMCMAMLPQWNAYRQGLVVGVIGLLMFVIMIFVRRKMEGKQMIAFNGKAVLTVLFGIAGVLALGTVGIVALLCLIPVCKWLK